MIATLAKAQYYMATPIGTLGGSPTSGSAINNAGTVVGVGVNSSGVEHAFIFSNGEISEIGAGTSTQSGAEGINNSGTIVGNANFPPNTWSQAAVYAGNGTWTDLGTVSGGAFSFATAINDSGTIVGQSSIAPNPIYAVPFVCTGAVMTSLGTLDGSMWAIAAEINSSGTIVGSSGYSYYSGESDPTHAFVYSQGSMTDIGSLGGASSRANAINDSGVVVGMSQTGLNPFGAYHAFSYSNGTMSDLGTLSAGGSSGANAINGSGMIVGSATNEGGQQIAAVFSGGAVTDLNTVTGGLPTSTLLVTAEAINSQGMIVANSATDAYLLTPTNRPPPPVQTLTPSPTPTLTPTPTPTPTLSPSRLINLSARANVGSSANILIVGFTISGTGSKQVLLRGIGPTLAAAPFNVPGALANPSLTLLSGSGAVLATDSSWGGTPQLENAFAQSGAFALSATSADSAMINTVSAGSYTSQLSGIGSSEGVGLAEIFDLDSGVPSTSLVNLSARAEVGNGANILIVGFVVSGQQQQTVLLRGVGPALASFNVPGTLAQASIGLYDSTGVLIAVDNGWGNAPVAGNSKVSALIRQATTADMSNVGAFSLANGSGDSAMVATLPQGSYTLEMSGTSGTTGVGLVELYAISGPTLSGQAAASTRPSSKDLGAQP